MAVQLIAIVIIVYLTDPDHIEDNFRVDGIIGVEPDQMYKDNDYNSKENSNIDAPQQLSDD